MKRQRQGRFDEESDDLGIRRCKLVRNQLDRFYPHVEVYEQTGWLFIQVTEWEAVLACDVRRFVFRLAIVSVYADDFAHGDSSERRTWHVLLCVVAAEVDAFVSWRA